MKRTEEKDLWIRRHGPFKLHRGEESLCDLGDTFKRTNLQIIGVPRREAWEKEAESLFKEIMA